MAAKIPSVPIDEISAGDTARWTREFDDYLPVDGWVLSYTMVGTTALLNLGTSEISTSTDGLGYVIDVPASTTSGWASDRYKLLEVLTNSITGERHTANATWLRVHPDLAAATVGSDQRTHARKMLDAINAWLESKAPVAGSMEINGRKIAYFPLPDLLKLRDRYRAEVAREEAGPGKTRGTRILSVL